MSDFTNDKSLQKFAELMIKKIEEVSDDYKKPWFSTVGHGLPQNVEGRIYAGMNSFMLFLLCDEMQYKTPVFMTFAQAKEQGVNVLKGEKSFPVVYWNFLVKDDSGNKITLDEYKALSKQEQKEYTVIPYTKYHLVFNVDQTNFSEIHPDKWKAIQQKFGIAELKDDKGMLSCPQLDKMLKDNAWLCPIVSEPIDRAFYRQTEDKVYLPLKQQFYNGEGFYTTLLHEMAHSTGIESRLGRELKNKFGSPKYAKEELVAEFTSAVTCRSLGIVSGIQEENAQYLKNWLGVISEEPTFIFSVLTDVGKASTMILNEVCHELTVSAPSQAVSVVPEEQSPRGEFDKPEQEGEKRLQEQRPETKNITSAFTHAIVNAIGGQFQGLIDLKQGGYSPSGSDLKLLQEIAPSVRPAVENIFRIKIDPLQFIEVKGGVTQLSLNF